MSLPLQLLSAMITGGVRIFLLSDLGSATHDTAVQSGGVNDSVQCVAWSGECLTIVTVDSMMDMVSTSFCALHQVQNACIRRSLCVLDLFACPPCTDESISILLTPHDQCGAHAMRQLHVMRVIFDLPAAATM